MDFLKILVFLILVLCFAGLSSQSLVQYLEFHRNTDCTDLSGTLENTDLTIGTRPGFFDAKAFKANGMWRVHSKMNDTTTKLDLDYRRDLCVPSPPGHMSYSAAERLGNAAQNISFLVFFMERGLTGVGINSQNTSETNLLRTFMALSWFFEGDDSWTVYSGENFTGDSQCLAPHKDVTESHYGFTYDFNSRLIVRSGKIGCTSGTGTTGKGVSLKGFVSTFLLLVVAKVMQFNHI